MPKEDKIRRKNVRGKAYNKERIMELFDEGYSYEQIAKKLHIKSIQSLRHSVEEEVKKRAERLLQAQREMEIKEQQRKEQMRLEELKRREEERVKRENIKRREDPQLTGLMNIYCDDTTLELFKEICDNLGFVYRFEDGIFKIYIPLEIPMNIEQITEGPYWPYFFIMAQMDMKYPPIRSPRKQFEELLFALGFYLKLERGRCDGKRVNIYASHRYNEEGFDEETVVNGFIHIEPGEYAASVMQSLADLFTSGKVSLDDFNNIEFREFDGDFQKARKRLREEGYYLRLCYDPLLYMRERNKSYILQSNYLLVLDKRSYQELISEYDSLGASSFNEVMVGIVEMETLALMVKEVNKELGDSKITPEQVTIPLINSWKKRGFSRVFWSLHPFPLPIIGEREMLEANQDREMADALEKIFEFVEGKIQSIPGNWSTEITSILLQKSQ